MIDRDEIVNRSEELRVHTSHVQRDYIFGWLLSGIYRRSELADKLVLKGGNAFRKSYFEKARYSPDLDFATAYSLPDDYLLAQLNSVCEYIAGATGVEFDTHRTRVDPTRLADRNRAIQKATRPADKNRTIQKARVYFKDFFGEQSQIVLAVRFDVSNYERIFLEVQECELIHQYSDAAEASATIRCLKLEELLASKLKCLLQRRHSVDLYDFVNATLIRPVVAIDRAEMIRTFLHMTIFGSGPRIVQDLLVNLPFQIIRGLWDQFLVAPKDADVDFDEAVTGFTGIVADLFGNLPVGSSRYAFFPSDLRNPIMQAGHDLTLLRIQYDGIERMVEPYSLKFKRRRDGLAREYFYVYDTTGGRSSGPGLKSFVRDKVGSVENTDVEFQPRCEVEISKAGQMFGETYFKGSPGPRFPGIRTSSKHVVQCTLCGKRFYRKRYSTKINPHKDTHGSRCPGRVGIVL